MAMSVLERHCRRRGCACTHSSCDRGWIDLLDEHGHTVSTRPCLTCREELAVALLPAETPAQRRAALAEHAGHGLVPA